MVTVARARGRCGGALGARVITDLEAELGGADTVCVSVATLAVPEVLGRLAPAARRLSLVLDTPVFGRPTHLRSLPLLHGFA